MASKMSEIVMIGGILAREDGEPMPEKNVFIYGDGTPGKAWLWDELLPEYKKNT